MARVLYTVAAYARARWRPAHGLLHPSGLTSTELHAAIEGAESEFRALAAGPRPVIAWFGSFMDAWGSADHLFETHYGERAPAIAATLRELREVGAVELEHPETIAAEIAGLTDRTRHAGAVGAYAVDLVLASLGAAMPFAHHARCDVLVMRRTLGPSFDDAELSAD